MTDLEDLKILKNNGRTRYHVGRQVDTTKDGVPVLKSVCGHIKRIGESRGEFNGWNSFPGLGRKCKTCIKWVLKNTDIDGKPEPDKLYP